jgi:hypothetical protein
MTRCMGIITKGAKRQDIAKCQCCKLLPGAGDVGVRQENDPKAKWVVNPHMPCEISEPK